MMKKCIWATAAILALTMATAPATAEQDWQFRLFGIGGGGGIFVPSFSPDGQTMFVASDMGQALRSEDGGRNWEMIHWRQINHSNQAQPHFVPAQDGESEGIYWASGRTLRFSSDRGRNWSVATQGPPWEQRITHIDSVVSDGELRRLFVGTPDGLWTSTDRGESWDRVGTGPHRSVLHVGDLLYAAVGEKLLVSEDHGESWQERSLDLIDGRGFVDLTGGQDENGTVLFALVQDEGTFRSTDGGESWDRVFEHRNFRQILMPRNQTRVIYTAHNGRSANQSPQDQFDTVFRSRDGGDTWERVFRMRVNWGPQEPDANVHRSWVQTEMQWGYFITNRGVTVGPEDPNLLALVTQGELFISRDGGDSWTHMVNEDAGEAEDGPGLRYRSIGMEVAGGCGPRSRFLFSPFDENRVYMMYNDFGFIRSTDRGETWAHSTHGSPWRNTFYDVVFDPQVPGRIYAAASNRHDIPHWTHITPNDPNVRSHRGGVVVSNDHGVNWEVLGEGLPDRPTTTIVIDPATTEGDPSNRTFYVSVFGEGVYKSTDGGQTWQQKNNGLGNEGNMHVVQVDVHPTSGEVFAAITAKRMPPGTEGGQFPIAGGIWRSRDGGENWEDITADLGMRWITCILLDPEDTETIWFTAAEPAGSYPTPLSNTQGGLYRTTDGGRNWTRVLNNQDFHATGGASFSHAMNVNRHPTDPNRMFLGGNHGLWTSSDRGENWRRVESLPHAHSGAVTVDPQNPNHIYVTTFGGGYWHGVIPQE